MFFAPHLGWRRVASSERRTRADWAGQVRKLVDEDFPAEVAALLRRHGVPAAALVLEVTESILMEDRERAVRVLEYANAPEARTLMESLAKGEEGSAATLAAKAALTRRSQ